MSTAHAETSAAKKYWWNYNCSCTGSSAAQVGGWTAQAGGWTAQAGGWASLGDFPLMML